MRQLFIKYTTLFTGVSKMQMQKILVLGLAMCSLGYAGGLQNKTNASVEYLRTQSRNATTETDAPYFNPAGVARFQDGFFANVSNQIITKQYSHEIVATKKEYSEHTPTYLYPNLHLGYKKGIWGAFFSFTVPAGGGKVVYDEGSATTAGLITSIKGSSPAFAPLSVVSTKQYLESSSAYHAYTLGSAISIKDMFAFSLAGRVITAKKETKTNLIFGFNNGTVPVIDFNIDSDYEESATGFSGLIGLDFTAIKNLVIALKYEFNTNMEFEQKVNKADVTAASAILPATTTTAVKNGVAGKVGQIAVNGKKYEYDLPGFLAGGISYTLLDKLEASFSANYYFNKNASLKDREDTVKNSWEIAFGAQYAVIPNLTLSIGYSHGNVGANSSSYGLAENPDLDFNSLGGGLKFSIKPNLHINAGVGWFKYVELESADKALRMNKSVVCSGIGIVYSPSKKADKKAN
jgi:long-chain fatty acid transport protein